MHEVETYEDNERLVYWVVNRAMRDYQLAHHERDDLEQEGRIALLKAVDIYNSREDLRQYKFATIAFKHIRTSIVRYISRTIGKHKAVTSLNAPVKAEDGETELLDLLRDEETDTYRTAERRMESHRVRVALAELTTDEELELLYKHHAFKVSLRALGSTLGVTGETMRQKINKVLRKIRKSKWYHDERQSRVDSETGWIKARTYTYQPERRQRAGRHKSMVEQIALERERQEETYRRMVAEFERQGLIEPK